MISTIIDYLDLPISKKVEELHYYGRGKAFICYDYECTQIIQVDLSIDIIVNIWEQISIEVFSFDKPTTTLCLTQNNFRVNCGLTFEGRLKYDPFYIASLD